MRKGLVLAGAWMIFVLAGCSSDPREGLVGTTVDLLFQTTTKVDSIREGVETAIKKADKGDKTLILQDALRACDELKSKGKELQNAALKIRGIREGTSEDDRQEYLKKFQGRIQDGVKKLTEATLALNAKLKELDQFAQDSVVNKAAVDDLRKKIREAQGEFDSLARRS